MYPDVQDVVNAVGPIVDGLVVDGLVVVGLGVVGLVVDSLAVLGLPEEEITALVGFLVVGFLVGLACSARVVITFSSVFSSTRTEARLLDLFLNKPTSASYSRLEVTSVVSCSERGILDAYEERNIGGITYRVRCTDKKKIMRRCQFLTASTILLIDPLPTESMSRIANDSCETCISTG
jgi:hypothetical protein